MTRKKAPPPRDPLCRLAPGERHVYWRDSLGGSPKVRARIFAAAAQAAAEGHVSLHVQRDPTSGCSVHVAIGRVR